MNVPREETKGIECNTDIYMEIVCSNAKISKHPNSIELTSLPTVQVKPQ